VALKAPVEYVRACKVYGAGFYTVPSTEACIKIGGYVRLQGTFNGSGEGTVNGADNMAPQGRNSRTARNPAAATPSRIKTCGW
jgi:Porin subfamily